MRASVEQKMRLGPAMLWVIVGLTVIAAYCAATRALLSQLVEFDDVRHHVDFTVGIRLPLHVAWQPLGGWQLTIAVWLLAASLAYVGWRCANPLREAGSVRGALVAQCVLLAALLFVTVTFSGDVYAYVIYGRLYGLHGLNPYVLGAPLQIAGDPVLGQALAFYGNPPPSDNYGPLWTLLAGLVARLEASSAIVTQVWTHRAIAAAAAVACTAALAYMMRRIAPAERVARVSRWALHPLVLYEAAVGGHNDLLMIAPALWAFALADELPLFAGLLLGASIAVKYVSLMLLPFMAVRIARRGAVAAALAVVVSLVVPVVCFAPFWAGAPTLYSLIGHGGELAMSPQWLVDIPFFASGTAGQPAFGGAIVLPLFGQATWPRIVQLLSLLAFATVAVVSIVRYARRRALADIWRTLTAAVLSLPIIHPWYLTWTTTAVCSRGRWSTYAWWLGLLGFLRYALDGWAPAQAGPAYTGVLALLTAIMLGASIALALRDSRQAQRPS